MWEEDLNKVLTVDWLTGKKNALRLQQELHDGGTGSLSRRFNNEVRDALDHLFRVAEAQDEKGRVANINSISEHLRRASVESLEFLVEQKLFRIRPVPSRWFWEAVQARDGRVIREFLKKLLLIRPRYNTMILRRIQEGQRSLAEARRQKGLKMTQALDALTKAYEAFVEIEQQLDGGAVNQRVFDLVARTVLLLAGFGATLVVRRLCSSP